MDWFKYGPGWFGLSDNPDTTGGIGLDLGRTVRNPIQPHCLMQYSRRPQAYKQLARNLRSRSCFLLHMNWCGQTLPILTLGSTDLRKALKASAFSTPDSSKSATVLCQPHLDIMRTISPLRFGREGLSPESVSRTTTSQCEERVWCTKVCTKSMLWAMTLNSC